MASAKLSLHDLVESIMNAISDAQDKIERQTMDNIQEWFDQDGRPKMVTFNVPALNTGNMAQQQGKETTYRELQIPLLTLMQNNPIKIKKLISKFQINLEGVDTVDTKSTLPDENATSETTVSDHTITTPMGSGDINRKRKILSTDIFGGGRFSKKRSQQASIEIEFESGEPTEAYLRLQNELLKLI